MPPGADSGVQAKTARGTASKDAKNLESNTQVAVSTRCTGAAPEISSAPNGSIHGQQQGARAIIRPRSRPRAFSLLQGAPQTRAATVKFRAHHAEPAHRTPAT